MLVVLFLQFNLEILPTQVIRCDMQWVGLTVLR